MELEHQLNDSGARVLVAHENLLSIASKAVKKTVAEHLVVTSRQDYQYLEHADKARKTEAGYYIPLLKLLQNYEPAPTHVPIEPKEDLAFLCYTGGTIGIPKRVHAYTL